MLPVTGSIPWLLIRCQQLVSARYFYYRTLLYGLPALVWSQYTIVNHNKCRQSHVGCKESVDVVLMCLCLTPEYKRQFHQYTHRWSRDKIIRVGPKRLSKENACVKHPYITIRPFLYSGYRNAHSGIRVPQRSRSPSFVDLEIQFNAYSLSGTCSCALYPLPFFNRWLAGYTLEWPHY